MRELAEIFVDKAIEVNIHLQRFRKVIFTVKKYL